MKCGVFVASAAAEGGPSVRGYLRTYVMRGKTLVYSLHGGVNLTFGDRFLSIAKNVNNCIIYKDFRMTAPVY